MPSGMGNRRRLPIPPDMPLPIGRPGRRPSPSDRGTSRGPVRHRQRTADRLAGDGAGRDGRYFSSRFQNALYTSLSITLRYWPATAAYEPSAGSNPTRSPVCTGVRTGVVSVV